VFLVPSGVDSLFLLGLTEKILAYVAIPEGGPIPKLPPIPAAVFQQNKTPCSTASRPNDRLNGLRIITHFTGKGAIQSIFRCESRPCWCDVKTVDCVYCCPSIFAGTDQSGIDGDFVATVPVVVGKTIQSTVLAPWRNGAPEVGAQLKDGDTIVTVWMLRGGSLLYPITWDGGPSGALECEQDEFGFEWEVQTFRAPVTQAAARQGKGAIKKSSKKGKCACGNFKTQEKSDGLCNGCRLGAGTGANMHAGSNSDAPINLD